MPFVESSLPLTWLVLGGTSVAVVLLTWDVWHDPRPRRRALLGCLVMAGIVVATGGSLTVLAPHGPRLSQRLLPLLAPILVGSVYRLTFPPDPSLTDTTFAERGRSILLTLLTGLALLGAGCLVIVDLLFS